MKSATGATAHGIIFDNGMTDLFLSYRTLRAIEVAPLVEALTAAGVDVWRDVDRIREADSITKKVRHGLAGSRVLAVYATPDYIDSLVCAWELASAWIAAETTGQPTNRVLLLQPPGVDISEIRVGALRDALAFDLGEGLDVIAGKISEHLADLDERSFGDLAPVEIEPDWSPFRRAGSNRFTGRWAQLWDLHSKLNRAETVGISGEVGRDTAQVRGLGGIGKSLLAIEYARRFSAKWSGGVFWIDVDSTWASAGNTPADLNQQREAVLTGLASSLGVSPTKGDPSATAADVVRVIKARADKGHRFLWIIDNAPPGMSQLQLEAIGPPAPGGSMLITTRWRALSALGEHLDLEALAPADALRLLTAKSPPSTTDERNAAEELTRALGYHPLALDVLRALVDNTAAAGSCTPYAAWRTRLQDPSLDEFVSAAEELEDELPTGCSPQITQVLAASFEDLPAAALDLLRLTVNLAEEPIPSSLLASVLERAHSVSATQFETALHKLHSRSLVTRSPQLKEATVIAHALVKRVVQYWKSEAEHLTTLTHAMYEEIAHRFHHVLEIEDLTSLRALLPHALACAKNRDAKGTRPVLEGAAEESACNRLWHRLGNYYQLTGNYRAARQCFECALDELQATFGPTHPYTLDTLHNLAGVQLELNDHASAHRHYKWLAEQHESEHGPTAQVTLSAKQHLATALESTGDVHSAIALYSSVLADQQIHIGEEHPDTLGTKHNLALAMRSIGLFREARSILEQVVAAHTRKQPPDIRDLLLAQESLCTVLAELGEFDTALSLLSETLRSRTERFGAEHPDTLRVAFQVIAIEQESGRVSQRDESLRELLREAQDSSGPKHTVHLDYESLQGHRLLLTGHPSDARRVFEGIAEESTLSLGETHIRTLNAKINLAAATREAGDAPLSLDMLSNLRTSCRDFPNPEHPISLHLMYNLALTQLELKQTDEALFSLDSIIHVYEHRLGAKHPKVLEARMHRAGCWPISDTERARDELQNIAADLDPGISGRGSVPLFVEIMDRIAKIDETAGRAWKAHESLEKGFLTASTALGPNHPIALAARHNLALIQLRMGRRRRSLQEMTSVRALMEKVLGAEHQDTIRAERNLRVCYSRRRRRH